MRTGHFRGDLLAWASFFRRANSPVYRFPTVSRCSRSQSVKRVWNYEIGHIRNKEPQYYTDCKKNSYIKEGNLVIEARLEEFKGTPYTSASLNTKGTKSFQYGRVEMRAKLPHGPAI